MRLSPWLGGIFDFLDVAQSSPELVRFWPWRDDRRGLDDGYSGVSLGTGFAGALPLRALTALAGVLEGPAGLNGLEDLDFEALEVTDDVRLGGLRGSQKVFTL